MPDKTSKEGGGGGRKARPPRRDKLPLTLWDRLKLQEKKPDHTLWQGDRGVYVFEATGTLEPKKPIRRVYLNRTYLTGLFKSRVVGEWTGDLKEPDKKLYLVFRSTGPGSVEIFSRE